MSSSLIAAPISLLLLEDNVADADWLMEMLSVTDHYAWQVTHAMQLNDALGYLNQTRFDVALLNLSPNDSQGLTTITQVQSVAPNLPIIVLSEINDQQLALQVVVQGAQDYLVKRHITVDNLIRVIRYAIERGQILRQFQLEVAERQRSEQALRLIVEGTAAVTGEAFFKALVRSLAEALQVRYAFVSGCIDTPPTRVCTYAFWLGDEFGQNEEYDLYGTPCEKVFSSGGCQYYPEKVQTFFPEDEALIELQVECYVGIPLFSSAGQILGHLAVMDDKLLANKSRNTAILKIFAARAAAEIERQQMEETLRVSQEKFSKAFRASPNAITLSTLSDGCYIEVNDSCLQLFGYCLEEMIGSSSLDLGIWGNADDRELLKQRIHEQGRVTNLEAEFRKKSGEVFSGLMSAEVIQLDDTPCLLSVTTDISLIKEATKAIERLAEIGELASMIVHEIRNPLTTLLMGLNSFKRLELSERYRTYLGLSLDEGERLQRLLNQILLFAKPHNLDRSTLELNSFIAAMLDSLRGITSASGKYLEFRPASGPLKILADADKLKQVVINLVTNAFEAVDSGDSILLAVQSVQAHRVCIQVHNGGTPIPDHVLPKLTKPFVTTKSNGTGLGLAIVKRIVEAHDGELIIESTESLGTAISVQLPVIYF